MRLSISLPDIQLTLVRCFANSFPPSKRDVCASKQEFINKTFEDEAGWIEFRSWERRRPN